jgi:hypothetical protein
MTRSEGGVINWLSIYVSRQSFPVAKTGCQTATDRDRVQPGQDRPSEMRSTWNHTNLTSTSRWRCPGQFGFALLQILFPSWDSQSIARKG